MDTLLSGWLQLDPALGLQAWRQASGSVWSLSWAVQLAFPEQELLLEPLSPGWLREPQEAAPGRH